MLCIRINNYQLKHILIEIYYIYILQIYIIKDI